MNIVAGDIWSLWDSDPTSWIVVPYGGIVGESCLTKDAQRQIELRSPEVIPVLHRTLKDKGNNIWSARSHRMIFFPTRHSMSDVDADPYYIGFYAFRLESYLKEERFKDVVIYCPPLGAGPGHLAYSFAKQFWQPFQSLVTFVVGSEKLANDSVE